jgi:small subunit ribosomal protein S13
MARIAGITIPTDKQVLYALTYIHGIGRTSSAQILKHCGVEETVRVKDLSDPELTKIREYIRDNYTVEGELQRVVRTNVKRLIDIGSYRGLRHRNNLPVRGQRTKTNARTKRGRRIAVSGAQPKSATKT